MTLFHINWTHLEFCFEKIAYPMSKKHIYSSLGVIGSERKQAF